MTTRAMDDFAEIARNHKRINDEQTWRAKDAGYGDTAPEQSPVTEPVDAWGIGAPDWGKSRCGSCGFWTRNDDATCDGGGCGW